MSRYKDIIKEEKKDLEIMNQSLYQIKNTWFFIFIPFLNIGLGYFWIFKSYGFAEKITYKKLTNEKFKFFILFYLTLSTIVTFYVSKHIPNDSSPILFMYFMSLIGTGGTRLLIAVDETIKARKDRMKRK